MTSSARARLCLRPVLSSVCICVCGCVIFGEKKYIYKYIGIHRIYIYTHVVIPASNRNGFVSCADASGWLEELSTGLREGGDRENGLEFCTRSTSCNSRLLAIRLRRNTSTNNKHIELSLAQPQSGPRDQCSTDSCVVCFL